MTVLTNSIFYKFCRSTNWLTISWTR